MYFIFRLFKLSYLCRKGKSCLIHKITLKNNLKAFNYSWMDVDKIIYMLFKNIQYKVKLKFPTDFGIKFI